MKRIIRLSAPVLVALAFSGCGGGGGDGGPTGPQSRVASVVVTPGTLTLAVGASQQLTATALDQSGDPVPGLTITWTSTVPTVAAVSALGVVNGIGPGSATITATAEGKGGSAAISVPVPVASITVAPGEMTLLAGTSQQLAATPRDEDGDPLAGRAVDWTTTAPSIAAVSAAGMVLGVGAGSATITATSEGKSASATVTVIPPVTFTSVSAGGAHTCALTTTGAAFCWGRGESGQLGIPVPSTTCVTDAGPAPCSMVPVSVQGGLVFTQLAGGGAHTCALTDDGTAYCWGHNDAGQLGDNSQSLRDAPVPVVTGLKFASIDAGARHTCALTDDGTPYCWGSNIRGQLGDGTTANRSSPVAVAGGRTFQLIVAGGFNYGHTCGLSGDEAYCWGDNERGQLGIGTGGFGNEDLTAHPEPTLVPGGLAFTSLTAGLGRHTCGRTAPGAAHCWGENSFGALGNGSTTDSPIPVPVSGGLEFVQLVAGGFIGHSCGLTAGGTGYCWGENATGQVGDGSMADRLEPAAVTAGLSFTLIDAGYRHTCARATTGTVYCWGSGGAGQLGVNSTNPRATPTKVLGQP